MNKKERFAHTESELPFTITQNHQIIAASLALAFWEQLQPDRCNDWVKGYTTASLGSKQEQWERGMLQIQALQDIQRIPSDKNLLEIAHGWITQGKVFTDLNELKIHAADFVQKYTQHNTQPTQDVA